MIEQPAPAVAQPQEPTGPVLKVRLPEGKLEVFQKEIERARQLRENKIAEWQVQDNLTRYAPAEKHATGVNVGVDFRDVERKSASLFYDTAHVSVLPDGEGDPAAARLHQELLNGLLSARKMRAKATATKAVKDCLVAIQPAFTKIGYVPTSVDVPDPMTGQPVSVVVHEDLFWARISGQAGLLPADFKDTDYDKAPWQGYDWKMSCSQAIREFGLPAGWEPPKGGDRKTTFTDETDRAASSGSDPQCSGVTLYYKTHLFDDTVRHPELIRELVLMDGWEGPVKHEDLSCQELGPDGRLTPNSLVGFPTHLLALRDLPDSAWVPADSSQTGPLTKEINTYLDQAKAQRDSNRLILLTDIDAIDADAIDKVKALKPLETMGLSIIPVAQGKLQGGADSVMKQVPGLTVGRETYAGLDRFERHRDQILGISQNQSGVQSQTKRTATENQIIERNSEARFEQERQRVLDWWLAGIRNKLSPLVMRYGDRLAVEILGPQRGQQWAQFREQGQLGPFTFELAIDSGKYLDVESKRRQTLQVFNLLAKSPFAKQDFFVGQICDEFGWDRAQAMTQPQPPKPEPPKINLSFSGTDFAQPQAPICLSILQAMGVQVDPQAVANTQKLLAMIPPETAGDAPAVGAGLPLGEHGGPADKAERIDQHMGRETGGIENAPSPAGVM